MLPESHRSPTQPAQRTVYLLIAGFIPGQLIAPERAIGPRQSAMNRATMPKTAVNEDRKSRRRENEIRAAIYSSPPAPSHNAVFTKDCD
jgi:hypothetical protein